MRGSRESSVGIGGLGLLLVILIVAGAANWLLFAGGRPDSQPQPSVSPNDESAPPSQPEAVRDTQPAKTHRAPESHSMRRPSEAPEQGSAAEFTITGRLVTDREVPLADTELTLRTLESPGAIEAKVRDQFAPRDPYWVGWARRELTAKHTTRTTADGSFRFGVLREAIGLIEWDRSEWTTEHALGFATAREDIDLGVIRCVTASTIDGVVLDAGDRGIGDAKIALHPGSNQLLDANPLQEVATEAGGAFQVRGLMPGKYLLVVRAPGFVSRGFEAVAPNARAEFRLRPGSRLRGFVVDRATESPISGARVTTREDWVERVLSDGGVGRLNSIAYRQPIQTDHTGRFELTGIGREKAFVVATAPGYSFGSRYAKVGDEIRIELDRVASLRGRVEDTEGRPVVGAAVKPSNVITDRKRGRSLLQRPPNQSTTNANGEFWFPAVQPVGWRLEVTHPEFQTVRSRHPAPAPGEKHTKTIVLHRGCGLDVTVVDDASRPVAGASVSYARKVEKARPSGKITVHEIERTGTTDALGKIILRGLSGDAGRVEVRVGGIVQRAEAPALNPTETPELTVRLSPVGAVRVSVFDADGKPARDLRIDAGHTALPFTPHRGFGFSLGSRDGLFRATTDTAGIATVNRLPVGVYRVISRMGRGPYEAIDATIAAGRTTEVELRFPKLGSIVVHARGPNGEPINGLAVLHAPAIRQDRGLRTTNGTARFERVPAGRYHVMFFRIGTDFTPFLQTASVTGPAEASVQIHTRPIPVTFTVHDPAGQPLTKTRVEVRRVLPGRESETEHGAWVSTLGFRTGIAALHTETDGTTHFDLPPGRYRVICRHDNHGEWRESEVVPSPGGSAVHRTLHAPQCGTVRVTLGAAAGGPGSVLEFEQTRKGHTVKQVLPRSEAGAIQQALLPPGSYRVRIAALGRGKGPWATFEMEASKVSNVTVHPR